MAVRLWSARLPVCNPIQWKRHGLQSRTAQPKGRRPPGLRVHRLNHFPKTKAEPQPKTMRRRCRNRYEKIFLQKIKKNLRKIKKFVILRLQAAKQKPGLGRSGWAGRHNGKRLLGALTWLVGTWKTSITAKNVANSRCLVDMKTLSSAGA